MNHPHQLNYHIQSDQKLILYCYGLTYPLKIPDWVSLIICDIPVFNLEASALVNSL